MVKVKKDDKAFQMYPKPSMSMDRFYKLSIGEKVITRYMGPGIVVYPPIRYKHENGVVKVYRDTALIKLSRKCWDHLEEQEFPFYELTTNSYGYGD
jgi:hypothetical protein